MSLGERATIISNINHIRIANTDTGGYALLCLHCGEIYVPSLPTSIDMFLTIGTQFQTEHNNCACPPTGPHDSYEMLRKADLRHLVKIERKGDT